MNHVLPIATTLLKENQFGYQLTHFYRLPLFLQQIVVCIDPDILHGDQLSAENTLLQKLELLGAGHEIVTQLIPSSVTWKRLNVEHTVDDTLQVHFISNIMLSRSVL